MLRRVARAAVRAVPWWAWVVLAFAAIGVVADRLVVVGGVAGAVAVIGLLVVAVRRAGRHDDPDWQQAERAAAQWCRDAGCRKVTLTSAGADGGIDVLTAEWAVQVKHTERRVGRPAIQQIVGAAIAVERHPAIVSTSGFTKPAVEFADEHRVALIELDRAGRGIRLNEAARRVGERRRGLLRRR